MRSILATLRSLTLPFGAGNGPRTVIGATPPADLIAYYIAGAPQVPTAPETIVGLTLNFDGTGNYSYQALVIDSSGPPVTSIVFGASVAGVVGEFQRTLLNPGISYPNGAVRTYLNLNELGLFTGALVDDTITVFNSGVHGDTFGRFEMNAAGAHYRGPGGVADTDAVFCRAAVGVNASAPIVALTNPSDPTTAETWHNAVLTNGWTNFGGSNPVMRYRKVASPAAGVQLSGLIVPIKSLSQ